MKKHNVHSAIFTGKIILATVLFLNSTARSQQPPLPRQMSDKPACFQLLPDTLVYQQEQFDNLFSLPLGSMVDVRSVQGISFTGQLSYRSVRGNIAAVLVRSNSYPQAVFSVQQQQTDGHSFQYRGKIVSLACSDAFQLLPGNTGYLLVRRPADYFIAE